MHIKNIKCDYQLNPVGVATATPQFSWIIASDQQNTLQTHYHFQLATDDRFSQSVWDSGEINSDASANLTCGVVLESAQKYFYRVRVKTNHDDWCDWSESYSLVTAILDRALLKGGFITAETGEHTYSSFASLFRTNFTVTGGVKAAYLFSSAKGMFKAYLNGSKVGDDVLSPGWTEYDKRLLFVTYEVTGQLREGKNSLGGEVGAGWYKGDLASWIGKRNIYGDRTAFYSMLKIVYEDGRQEIIATDNGWKTARSPIVYSELYHGETYDAQLEQKNWSSPDFDERRWTGAMAESNDLSTLTPHDGVVVKRHERFTPVSMITTPEGDRVIDFGQNISGWVELKVRGNAGDKVVLRHAEILDNDGNFYTCNLRRAKQRIEYICSGDGEELYEPSFTFQGFRYISVDEFPGDFNEDNFTAIAIYSDMANTGDFTSSNPLLNQLISNIRWGMRDNFVDIPTDCPQRDERLGWTGDANVFARAASYLMDTSLFFRKWLRDVAASQYPDGGVPHVVPDVLQNITNLDPLIRQDYGACGWADAAVIIPWVIYKYYGSSTILADQYDSMKAWVQYITNNSNDGLWNTGFHFGDWVALDAEEGSYFGATPNDLVATAFYAHCATLMAKTAKVLGKTDDEKYYLKLLEGIKAAYVKEFFEDGSLKARTQTAQILSLHFGLTPEEYKENVVNTLVQLIESNGNALNTGFLGTPYLCHALSDNGRIDVAYGLLLRTEYPSWLYQVTKGATTVWEHWDGLKEDGTMWSDNMNSFNHYAYGSVHDWIFSVVGGIDSDEAAPGYKKIIIKPSPHTGIDHAKAVYNSLYGDIVVEWRTANGTFSAEVEIPVNTTAEVTLPSRSTEKLGSGKYKFDYTI